MLHSIISKCVVWQLSIIYFVGWLVDIARSNPPIRAVLPVIANEPKVLLKEVLINNKDERHQILWNVVCNIYFS